MQNIATAVLAGGLVVGVILAALEKYLDEVVAAVSTSYSTIDYRKVTCVSIGPHGLTREGKDTPDPKLAKSITDILSIKTVLHDAAYAECPWDFFINATSGSLGIHYGAVSPEYTLAVGICERIDDRRVDPGKCLSKNVYVFSPFVRLHDLFGIAVIGLKPETPDMRPITMRANSDRYSRNPLRDIEACFQQRRWVLVPARSSGWDNQGNLVGTGDQLIKLPNPGSQDDYQGNNLIAPDQN